MAKANKLVTQTAFKGVPAIGTTDEQGDDAVVHVKFFSPLSGYRWFITEYDPETGEAFGLVQGHEVELGYISIPELQDMNDNFRGKFVMPPIERDLHFSKTTLGKVREKLERTGHA